MASKERRAERALVRRLAAVFLLIGSLVLAAAALGGPPRLEQKRLRPADMALARNVALKARDLAAGWSSTTPSNAPAQVPHCPGADLDFSRFTITGQARSAFAKGPSSVQSLVEVFKNRRDAVGDFRKATAPKVLACLGPELERQGRQQGLDVNVESLRSAGRPAVGERAFAVHAVLSVAGGAGRVRIYMDVIGVQRGRSGVALYFMGTSPVPGRLAVARSVAARMR